MIVKVEIPRIIPAPRKDSVIYYTSPVQAQTAGTLTRQKSLERQRSQRAELDEDAFDLSKEYRRIDEIYEKEREKRQRSRLQEEEKRRHNYVPTMAKSPVPGDRYDSVYEDPFNFSPGRPRSASPSSLKFGRQTRARSTSSHGDYYEVSELKGPARALYSFKAQNPRYEYEA